jgi:hypothetical protein
MPNAYKPVAIAPMLKGLAAETDYATQPKGTFPRGTNFLLNKRGALDVCDGTQLVHAFNGQVQSGRGKVMATFLFLPTGVPNYYLAVMKALDIPLGPPQNVTTVAASGGSLPAGAWTYVITSIDGAGGETTGSSPNTSGTGANAKVTITWNVVPNAQGYNVYRNGGLLIASNLPVPQVAAGNLTATFVDFGTAAVGPSSSVSFLTSGPPTNLGHVFVQFSPAQPATVGGNVTIAGATPAVFNGTYPITSVISSTQVFVQNSNITVANQTGTGGTILFGSPPPPLVDTTQQCALFQMPVIPGSPANLPVSYNNSNIVALYPADARPSPDGGGGGGSGGGGGTGGGGSSGGSGGSGTGSSSTPSGGILGNVSFIPQFAQFTNQAIIALGNGYPPQIFSDDTGTPTNPSTEVPVSAISVDAFGVVTVTTSSPHGMVSAHAGGNVQIEVAGYNYVGPTITIADSTHFTVRNLAAIGQAPSSGGLVNTTSLPIISTFVPGLPTWVTAVAYATNSIVTPTSPNGHLYKAIQGGVSGGSQPTFPTTTGAQVADGSIIWQEAGLTNTAAPPPPGC